MVKIQNEIKPQVRPSTTPKSMMPRHGSGQKKVTATTRQMMPIVRMYAVSFVFLFAWKKPIEKKGARIMRNNEG